MDSVHPTYATPQPWWKQQPSLPRLLLFSLVVGIFSVATLVAGMTWIQTYVPIATAKGLGVIPRSEAGLVAFGNDKERMNILVLGVDYNYTNQAIRYTKGARSDTMLVVSVNRTGDLLNVVSVPRDTWVLISEEWGYEKINAAYSYGGVKQALETARSFLGVPIDHYVVVKVDGAVKLVDTVGGVWVDVEKDMNYDDNWGNLHIHLKKGRQKLNGKQAVGYARFRMDEEGDRGRMRRQQQVMRALMARVKEHPIENGLKIARMAHEFVETDFQLAELADMARLYHDFDYQKMRGAAIVGDDAFIGEISVIVPYEPANQQIVRRLLRDSTALAASEMRVRVVNASSDSQAASRVADLLNLAGFEVIAVDDGDERIKQTRVLEHVDTFRAREQLRKELEGAKFVSQPANQEWDITVMVGEDRALEEWDPQPEYYQPAAAIRDAYPAYAQPVPAPRIEEPQAVAPEESEEPAEGAEEPAGDPASEAGLEPGSEKEEQPAAPGEQPPQPAGNAPAPAVPPQAAPPPVPPPVVPVTQPEGDGGWFEPTVPQATPLPAPAERA